MLTNGRVLIAGGLTSAGSQPVDSVELYDPATGTFGRIGTLLKKADAVSATLLADGRVLLLGSDTWTSGAALGGAVRAVGEAEAGDQVRGYGV